MSESSGTSAPAAPATPAAAQPATPAPASNNAGMVNAPAPAGPRRRSASPMPAACSPPNAARTPHRVARRLRQREHPKGGARSARTARCAAEGSATNATTTDSYDTIAKALGFERGQRRPVAEGAGRSRFGAP